MVVMGAICEICEICEICVKGFRVSRYSGLISHTKVPINMSSTLYVYIFNIITGTYDIVGSYERNERNERNGGYIFVE